ncbi:glutathione S-transferase [Melanogaster broomeanus]|nr:glutathione S-transferase [Melanogaster broomeanus]
MVIKIYSFPISTCARLVELICKEKDIPYELVDYREGEHKTPAFKEHQPFGQSLISEPLGLIPTDLRAKALFEQASSIEITNFDNFAGPLVVEKFHKPRLGGQTNEAKAAGYLATLNAKMDVYDVILGKQKYIAGETLTLADLQHLPLGRLLCTAGQADVFSSRPNVARWWNELTSRPAWNAMKYGA